MPQKTRKPKATKATPEPSVPLSSVYDMLAEAAAGNMPELAEVSSAADLDLALEDRGYIRFGDLTGLGGEVSPQQRTQRVEKARFYWHSHPECKQAVRLWVDYAVSTGIEYQCDDKNIVKQLDAFIKSRENKKWTSSAGQQRLAKKHLIDGELFLAIFTGDGGEKYIRPIEPLQITEFITDPNDEDEVVGYKRTSPATPTNPKPRTRYYLDWQNDPADVADAFDPAAGRKTPIQWEQDVVMYHFPFDDLGGRGNSLLETVVGWSRELRRFMESRVSITQALSKFAWKLVAKTGQKGLDKIANKLQSSLVNTNTPSLERNPVAIPASTAAMNPGMDITPMPRTTGASDAMSDMRMLKLQVCAGTGVFEHYMGDPSTGNLATSTAMELPMLKEFTAYQESWKDTWRDIFAIVLGEDIDIEDDKIKIELPEMLSDDLQIRGTFLAQVLAAFPEAKVPQVLQWTLQKMGLEDVEDIMNVIADKRKELDAQQQAQFGLEQQKAQLPQAGGPPQSAQKQLTAGFSPTQEALLERLVTAIESARPSVLTPMPAQEVDINFGVKSIVPKRTVDRTGIRFIRQEDGSVLVEGKETHIANSRTSDQPTS